MDNNLKSGLYIVATPIGNLQDISLRGLDILAKSDIILCEDTRVTSKLLAHYNIKAKFRVYNDHSTEKDREYIKDLIFQNMVVSLVSDAGTPLISDPGYKLIQELKANNLYYTAAPGASSLLTALVLSGLPSDKFSFFGFVPSKKEVCRKFFEEKKHIENTMIFFETAARLLNTLTTLDNVYQNRKIVIARELTKKFEEIKEGSAKELISYYNNNTLKGEIVLLIAGYENIPQENFSKEIEIMLKYTNVKTTSLILSKLKKVSKNVIYKQALKIAKIDE